MEVVSWRERFRPVSVLPPFVASSFACRWTTACFGVEAPATCDGLFRRQACLPQGYHSQLRNTPAPCRLRLPVGPAVPESKRGAGAWPFVACAHLPASHDKALVIADLRRASGNGPCSNHHVGFDSTGGLLGEIGGRMFNLAWPPCALFVAPAVGAWAVGSCRYGDLRGVGSPLFGQAYLGCVVTCSLWRGSVHFFRSCGRCGLRFATSSCRRAEAVAEQSFSSAGM